MNLDATSLVWKMRKETVCPLEKLVLLSLADRADEEEMDFSIHGAIFDTGLNVDDFMDIISSLFSKRLLVFDGLNFCIKNPARSTLINFKLTLGV